MTKKDNRCHRGFGLKLKSLVETDKRLTPKIDKSGMKDFITEILDAWKEARTYDDNHLYDDHLKWLRDLFDLDLFDYPDDYDIDSHRWTIGLLIAQVERYGGIVMETDKGTLPLTKFPTNVPDNKKETITER